MCVCAHVSSANACEFMGVSIHVCGNISVCAFKYGYVYKCEDECEPVDGWGFSEQRAWGKQSVRDKGKNKALESGC